MRYQTGPPHYKTILFTNLDLSNLLQHLNMNMEEHEHTYLLLRDKSTNEQQKKFEQSNNKIFLHKSFKDFANLGNIKIYLFACKFFMCTFKSFCVQVHIWTQVCRQFFKSVLYSFIALPLLEALPN